jgi:hypothetical protein
MKTKELVIAEPCRVDWSKMTPADGGRFCGDCKKVVTSLSSMTEKDARKLLRTANEGQLCVRFLHDKHGNVFFGADAPQPNFVPASLLSRAKRALAVAGLAAATQACSGSDTNGVSDVHSALTPPSDADDDDDDDQVYMNMGGVSYDPTAYPLPAEDAGSPADQDGGAPAEDAGAAPDAAPTNVPN